MTTTKRIAIIASTLIIALCALGCIVSFQLFWNGCLWWECAPARYFDVLDLELPRRLFPEQANYNSIYLDDDDDLETLRSSGQTIYWDNGNGLAIYIVDKYASNKNASRNFERTQKSFFSAHTDFVSPIPWSTPGELTYISPLADEFFLACGMVLTKDDYRCGVIARYQEFVLFFNATISEMMSYDDFQKIVIFMDEQISNHFYQK